MARKDVLIRGVDESVYRRAKSAAASRGITLGSAVDEALADWAKETENTELASEVDSNIDFVSSNWNKVLRSHKGEAVVVSEGKLQGVFHSYEEARAHARKKKVALVFVVDKAPVEKEIDFGAELEIQ